MDDLYHYVRRHNDSIHVAERQSVWASRLLRLLHGVYRIAVRDPEFPAPPSLRRHLRRTLQNVMASFKSTFPNVISKRDSSIRRSKRLALALGNNLHVDSDNERPQTEEGDETSETVSLQFSTSMGVEEYASAVDVRGFPNCSTLGEFFADPIMLKYGVLSMTYRRKEFMNPLATLMTYYKCVNSTPMWGFPAGTILLDDASFSATQYVDQEGEPCSEYDVTYKFSYKRGYNGSGWNVAKANAGMYHKNASNNIVRALNNDGSPTDQPVLLNAAGVRLDSISPTSAVNPLMLYYQVYPSADLTALGLPNPSEV